MRFLLIEIRTFNPRTFQLDKVLDEVPDKGVPIRISDFGLRIYLLSHPMGEG